MTREEARQILLLYRPDVPDADDSDLAEALALAQDDPELKQWLDDHLRQQTSFRRSFRSLPVPDELAARILAARQPKHVHLWRWHAPWLLAAATLILLGWLAQLVIFSAAPDRFENFQSRMVSTVLCEYRMDIVTNRDEAVRGFMAKREAPASYEIPLPLRNLKLTGGGLLRWRDHPVSMICYDRGTNQMIFLFVVNRQAPRDPPSPSPRVKAVNKLTTASWTQGDWVYFLAAEKFPGFPENYLPKRTE